MSAPTPDLANGKIRMNPPVFYFAASFILLFGLVVIAQPQAAGDMSHEKAGEFDQIMRQPSLVHEIAGQNEQGNRQQGKRRHPGKGRLRQHRQG